MAKRQSPIKTIRKSPDERPQKIHISKYVNQAKRPVFQVTFRLGRALRRVKTRKVIINLKKGVVSLRGDESSQHTNNTHITNMVQDSNGDGTQAAHVNGDNQQVDPQLKTHDYQTHTDQQNQLDGPTQADSQTDPDSEIEILEVRPAKKRRYFDPGSDPSTREKTADGRNISQSYYTESDLSSLDDELNEALTSSVARADSSLGQIARPNIATMAALPKLFIPPSRSRSPPPVGYRNIPPNLMNAIHREMNLVFDGSADDEIEVIGKRTFSLKDPIARTKIRLPIKATTCRHFECFDFFNFCLFYKLTPGTRGGLKRSLVLQSQEARNTERLFLKQQEQIQAGKLSSKAPGLVYPQFSEHGQMFFTDLFSRTPPLYKCPLCDEKFGLKQLYISDIFNFFVKTTPVHTTKIMLAENNRYKIVEEENNEQGKQEPEIVELSGDEEERSFKIEKQSDTEQRDTGQSDIRESDNEREMEQSMTESTRGEEEFNDGLDDFLSTITSGDGSWENPMKLD